MKYTHTHILTTTKTTTSVRNERKRQPTQRNAYRMGLVTMFFLELNYEEKNSYICESFFSTSSSSSTFQNIFADCCFGCACMRRRHMKRFSSVWIGLSPIHSKNLNHWKRKTDLSYTHFSFSYCFERVMPTCVLFLTEMTGVVSFCLCFISAFLLPFYRVIYFGERRLYGYGYACSFARKLSCIPSVMFCNLYVTVCVCIYMPYTPKYRINKLFYYAFASFLLWHFHLCKKCYLSNCFCTFTHMFVSQSFRLSGTSSTVCELSFDRFMNEPFKNTSETTQTCET